MDFGKIPPSWTIAAIQDFAKTQTGGTPSRGKPEYFKGTIPWVKSGELRDGVVYGTEECISQEAIENSSAKLIPRGTLCVALYGATIGKIGILDIQAATNQAVCSVLLPSTVSTKFIYYYFQSIKKELIALGQGGAQPNISNGIIRSTKVPLAPLGEQRRIVAKIEELFSDLDAGVAALERVRANLKRYRAAVLKAAVEGKLTEDWRAQHPDTEPASALLDRILTERRLQWERDQLAKYERAGKTPPKGWQEKYQEPILPDLPDGPRVPGSWTFASLDQLSTNITSGSRDWSQFYGRGTGTFLMAQNVRMGSLDLSYRQPVDPPADNRDRVRSQVEEGDILITIVGANTGEACRVPKPLPEHYVCQSVALARPVLPQISRFLECYLVSHENGQKQFRDYMYGAGRPHLSFDQIKMTAISLPPIDEQAEILIEVDRRLSIIDELESQVEANLKRSARLRQGILKRAFEGRLVPQDPGDEPASALLERLRRPSDAPADVPRARRGRKAKDTPLFDG